MILVRDWCLDSSLSGFEGGLAHLSDKLMSDLSTASGESAKVDVLDMFERKTCFLLSHPGEKVAASGEGNPLKAKCKFMYVVLVFIYIIH